MVLAKDDDDDGDRRQSLLGPVSRRAVGYRNNS